MVEVECGAYMADCVKNGVTCIDGTEGHFCMQDLFVGDHYGCFVVLELILVVAKFDNVVLDFSDFGQAFVLEIRDTHPHCSEIENEAPHLFGQVG